MALQIAAIDERKDGSVHVMLADKRGVLFKSRQAIADLQASAQDRLGLETLVAIAVPLDKAQDAGVIGKDVTAIDIGARPAPVDPGIGIKG